MTELYVLHGKIYGQNFVYGVFDSMLLAEQWKEIILRAKRPPTDVGIRSMQLNEGY